MYHGYNLLGGIHRGYTQNKSEIWVLYGQSEEMIPIYHYNTHNLGTFISVLIVFGYGVYRYTYI